MWERTAPTALYPAATSATDLGNAKSLDLQESRSRSLSEPLSKENCQLLPVARLVTRFTKWTDLENHPKDNGTMGLKIGGLLFDPTNRNKYAGRASGSKRQPDGAPSCGFLREPVFLVGLAFTTGSDGGGTSQEIGGSSSLESRYIQEAVQMVSGAVPFVGAKRNTEPTRDTN